MTVVWLFVVIFLFGCIGWLAVDIYYDHVFRHFEREYYTKFPDGCLRCVAEEHGHYARADAMGWEHTGGPRCRSRE